RHGPPLPAAGCHLCLRHWMSPPRKRGAIVLAEARRGGGGRRSGGCGHVMGTRRVRRFGRAPWAPAFAGAPWGGAGGGPGAGRGARVRAGARGGGGGRRSGGGGRVVGTRDVRRFGRAPWGPAFAGVTWGGARG